jgi:site-specific DNA recombinase
MNSAQLPTPQPATAYKQCIRAAVSFGTRIQPCYESEDQIMRAATFARLSDDGMSIPDQQKTARKYAEDRGWQVVAEFKDKHRSAFRKVERKGFEALLEAASDGEIDVIIARHQDRLVRHPETYSRLLEICVRRNIDIHI